jgi:iron complex transport system substrate-binding protein
MRIVSLDYCADQYVLRLVDRERILALSPDAEAPFSYMREAAAGVPKVRPRAEDVLILRPDLVVRTYGGGANAQALFERADVPVLQIGYAQDIAGVMSLVQEVATGLGEPARGAALVAEMQARLAALPYRTQPRAALYMTPGGVTSGPGTLVSEMLHVAGYANFQTDPGWRALPLERLAYEQPDVVVGAFFNTGSEGGAWSAMRHPLARRQLEERPIVALDGALTACDAWYLVDAVEQLAQAR